MASSYAIQVSATAGQFQTFPLQEDTGGTFGKSTMFTDGHMQTTGSGGGWADFEGRTTNDLQFYLSP